MRRRVAVLPILAVLLCMVAFFLWQSGQLDQSLGEIEQQYEQGRAKLDQLQGEQTKLKQTLKDAGSDEFIENQARTQYGYMMPDEIRFVITNPEALYGEEDTRE